MDEYPKCFQCQEDIQDEEYAIDGDKTFHFEHFTCVNCQQQLQNNNYLRDEDGNYDCVNCYLEKYPTDCHVCLESFNDDFIVQDNKLVHQKCAENEGEDNQNEYNNNEEEEEQDNNYGYQYQNNNNEKEEGEEEKEVIKHNPLYLDKLKSLKPASKRNQDQQQQSQSQQEEGEGAEEKHHSLYLETRKQLKPVSIAKQEYKKSSNENQFKIVKIEKKEIPLHQQKNRPRYSLKQLQTQPFPSGVDVEKRETFLSEEDFETLFKMTLNEFYQLKDHKQIKLKKDLNLF